MRISELIAKLQEIKVLEGDLVCSCCGEYGYDQSVPMTQNHVNVEKTSDFDNQMSNIPDNISEERTLHIGDY